MIVSLSVAAILLNGDGDGDGDGDALETPLLHRVNGYELRD